MKASDSLQPGKSWPGPGLRGTSQFGCMFGWCGVPEREWDDRHRWVIPLFRGTPPRRGDVSETVPTADANCERGRGVDVMLTSTGKVWVL